MKNPEIAGLRRAAEEALAEAKEINARAEGRGSITADEEAEVKSLLAVVNEKAARIAALDGVDKAAASLQGNLSPAGRGGSLLGAFKAAGWKPGARAVVPAQVAAKAGSFAGDADDISPTRHEGAALGADRRRLYGIFPATPEDAGTTSVQVVRQSSRTLADPGLMVRGITETSAKPETSTEREMVSLPMKQVASKESGIPNILLLQDNFRSTVDTDLQLAYEAAIDDLVADAIAASTPDPAGGAGIDLTEMIVFAAAAMATDGYSGTTVALNPVDFAELALLRGEAQVFARKDPLADYTFVQSPALTDPLLIDPSAAGRLYVSGVSLQSFEENDGATNTSLVRLEGTAAFNIERADAVRTITAGGS